MAKRRTRKQKEKAQHQLLVTWKPTKKASSQAHVKGQLENSLKKADEARLNIKKADNLEQEAHFEPIRKDILKSLLLASFVLALELVIYLVWS